VASVVGFAAGDLLWMDYGLWIMVDYDCGYYVIICSNYNGYYGLTIVISITVMVDYDYGYKHGLTNGYYGYYVILISIDICY